MRSFAAIIPAAGFSSRMGFFKPLLPFGSSLVIEKTIDTFKQAGITDIRVVVGFKRELIQPVLNRLSVQAVINYNFADGMYSSIKAGAETLDPLIDAFFILPGDCPFIDPDTIRILIHAYDHNPKSVIYPVYNGHRGHPALISFKLQSAIINSNPESGLKSLLEKAADFTEVLVQDPGIIYDMDTVRDYLDFPGNNAAAFPSEEECLELLRKANVNERVIRHSKEVSRIAVAISEYLNSIGRRINLGLVMAAGLLHDIARDQPDHAAMGAEVTAKLGYKEIADIIAQHMDAASDSVEALNEPAILYLADKMVKEDKLISLDKRLVDSLAEFGNDKFAAKNISERFNNAFIIKNKIENILGMRIEDILKD